MNLYKVMTNHYSPKDSHRAIWAYVVAESNEQLYEWIKSEPDVEDGKIYTCWTDWEDDSEEYEDEDSKFRTQMLVSCDEESTDFADYGDLYYGKTFISWELVKEDAKPDVLQLISDYGVRIYNAVTKED